MKKKVVFLTVILVLFATAAVIPAKARSLEEIRQSKEIRICIASDLFVTAEPPDCRDNCKFSGLIYEESLAFTAALGSDIQPKFFKIGWDEQFFNKEGKIIYEADYTPELLASGKCDFFPTNLTKNEWRSKKMDFVTLFPNRIMVIVRKSEKAGFKTVADLAGKTAAIADATSYSTWMKEQNRTVFPANPVRISQVFQTDEDGINAVETGKADFTLIDSDKAVWLARHVLKNATVAFPVGSTDEICWAFRKEDKDLQAAVQKFFDENRSATSLLNKIWESYFGITMNMFISIIKATE